jgi:hypothetical protein
MYLSEYVKNPAHMHQLRQRKQNASDNSNDQCFHLSEAELTKSDLESSLLVYIRLEPRAYRLLLGTTVDV